MMTDHVRCNSTDRIFSGNSVGSDQMLNYALIEMSRKQWALIEPGVLIINSHTL